MTEPLFRDPVHDGASDPTVLRDLATGELVMFYTQRRPDDPGPGVSWIHGSRIGVARSADGRTWRYDGVVAGLDPADALARTPTGRRRSSGRARTTGCT